jgi:integrase
VELPPKQDCAEIRFLDPDEVLLLVDAVPEGPYRLIDRALYTTAAMTGLRQGELIALRWRDVDWASARIRVRQNYVLGRFGTPKSRRSTRSVPMADRVASELARLSQAANRRDDDELVFADPHDGGPLSKPAILRRFRRVLAAAGLDTTRRFHDLRHTFGTVVAASGVPMRTLQEWMGHRDIATTQIYADYSPSPREAAYIQSAFGTAGQAVAPTVGAHPSDESPSPLGAGEQLAGRDPEPVGELDDRRYPHVSESALSPTDLDRMHAAAVGERLLRDPETLAVDADVTADLHLGLHGGDPRP